MSPALGPPAAAVAAALRLLGKRRLALAIHDSCFPGDAAADIGRGTPYGTAARQFLTFARGLGFDTIQLGPQGQAPRDDPSPYLGTLFSRSLLDLDLGGLAGRGDGDTHLAGLLDPDILAALAAGAPAADGGRSAHAYAFDASHAALAAVHRRFVERRAGHDAAALALDAGLATFAAANAPWLEPDALYHVLAAEHGWQHFGHWPAGQGGCPDGALYRHGAHGADGCAGRRATLAERHAPALERYRLGQYLLQRQHEGLRGVAADLGLRLYGDLQVGMSACDAWSRGGLYLAGYLMGAPPSRTNPEGQPWGYGVLDPGQYLAAGGAPGPVLRFLLTRMERMLADFDGLRIDHPHGLVCPWVYRADDPDLYRAVQQGARLFSSPDLTDHPALARHAIVRPDQLERSLPRHADAWVRDLEPHQVGRYALLLDAVVGAVRERGGGTEDVPCEVLSTLPNPLARVMERQGLGRFRVTQKADVDDPADVYRSDNARPEDWIMAGTHDTPPLWRVARAWQESGEARRQAAHLAARLVPERERAAFAAEVAADRAKLVHAKLAAAFASPAAQVMVFFPDLLGLEDIYNRAGVVHPDNWTLRVPRDYARTYPRAATRGEALNLPCVLALALRARGEDFARLHSDLIARLWDQARWWDEG